MTKTVIGFFDDASDAQEAVEQLVAAGFDKNNIDVTAGSAIVGRTEDTTETTEKGNAFSRFFSSLFGEDSDETKRYSKMGEQADSMVTVHTISSDQSEQAADILDACGASDVDEKTAEYAKMSAGDSAMSTAQDSPTDTIQRVEEELQVGKRTVETGGVRIRSRIVEKPVQENLRLRTEHVTVARKMVDRPAQESDWNNFSEKEIELTESAEVPVVSKTARVVEEISINKDVTERDETVRDSVRQTQVDIDDLTKDISKNSSL